jgi:hypothetical protein
MVDPFEPRLRSEFLFTAVDTLTEQADVSFELVTDKELPWVTSVGNDSGHWKRRLSCC